MKWVYREKPTLSELNTPILSIDNVFFSAKSYFIKEEYTLLMDNVGLPDKVCDDAQ